MATPPDINFEFEGNQYTVEARAYDLNRIVLPDGRILEATGWLESYPPQPKLLFVVDFFKLMKVEDFARLINASVARGKRV